MVNIVKYFIFFFESVTLFMAVFFFIQYRIIKRKEHLSYAIYLTCLTLYYPLAMPELFFNIDVSQAELIRPFDLFKRPLQFLSSFFYTLFMMYYLRMQEMSRYLYRLFSIIIRAYLVLALLCFLANVFQVAYDPAYYIISLLFFPLQFYVLVALFKHRVPYSFYIIWGSIITLVGSSLTLVYSIYLIKSHPGNLLNNARSYLPVQLSILVDMFLFTIALQRKIADNERLLIDAAYQRQRSILLERERIIADLHDDVGGGLSSIRMMSDLMAGQTGDKQINAASFAQKISLTAKDIAQRMHLIIWSLNAENDTLRNFCEYVRQYGLSFFENSPVTFGYECQIDLNAARQLSGVQRKNLFLILKESFHNILKHSGADKALVKISMENATLVIEISDNGKGISPDKTPAAGSGNGMKNMRKRMAEIKGTMELLPGNGTTIRLSSGID